MDEYSNEKAACLRRIINILEYDIPNIHDKKVKVIREAKLKQTKEELSALSSSIDGGIKHG